MGGLPFFRRGPDIDLTWEDNGELRPTVDVEGAATGLKEPGTEAPEVARGLDAGLKEVSLSGGAEGAEMP